MKKLIILVLLLFVVKVGYAADTKVSDLSAIGASLDSADLLYIIDAAGPTSYYVTVDDLIDIWTGSSALVTVGAITSGEWTATATDIPLAAGGTGASLSDPGADRIFFWDDGAGSAVWLVPNTGLSITGTNLNWDYPDGDVGDFTYTSGTAALDNDVIAAAEMADADHGDVSWTSGVAAVEDLTIASEAQGDILYFDGSNWIRLAKGTAGQVLEMNAGATAPEWDTDDSGTPGEDSISATELKDDAAPEDDDLVRYETTGTTFKYSSFTELLDELYGSEGLLYCSGGGAYSIAPTDGTVYVTRTSTDTLQNKTLSSCSLSAATNTVTGIDEDDCADASDLVRSAIEFVIDGGGSAISTGVAGYLEIPFNCTIIRSTLLADQDGAIAVDIWVDDTAAFDAGTLADADSITAAAVPTISASGNYDQDTTLSGWTTSLTAGNIMAFNVDSCTTITKVTVSLIVEK